ncbi:hypothetical protein [Mucilaginibacter pedocola]|nr:hypothetical protein [Mucilaginibacter pedocola]
MWSKDSTATGLLLGSILPAGSWVLFEYVMHNDAIIMNKPAVPYLLAIVLNLVLLRYFFRKDMQELVKGIMMATFAFMLIVFIFKIRVA